MASRVFFSFHYQDVIDFRANVIRNSGEMKGTGREAGFFDASVWESTKRQGADALKRLINDELENTSVTCVLIGSLTYTRPWVRYEILKSLKRRNKIIGVHINDVAGRDQQTKPLGPNPLAYLGVTFAPDGKTVTMYELADNGWVLYKNIDGSAYFQFPPVTTALRGHFYRLSSLCREYAWMRDNGYQNFATWIT